MPRSGPITLALPPFAGTTRKLIIINLVAFFGFAVLGWVTPRPTMMALGELSLVPVAVVRGEIWQLITYASCRWESWARSSRCHPVVHRPVPRGHPRRALADAAVPDLRCRRRPAGLGHHLHPRLRPEAGRDNRGGLGAASSRCWSPSGWSPATAVIRLYFLIPIKAKYFVAIYILISVAVLLKGTTVSARSHSCAERRRATYVRFAPRRGMAFSISERYFGMRNGYYRWKAAAPPANSRST